MSNFPYLLHKLLLFSQKIPFFYHKFCIKCFNIFKIIDKIRTDRDRWDLNTNIGRKGKLGKRQTEGRNLVWSGRLNQNQPNYQRLPLLTVLSLVYFMPTALTMKQMVGSLKKNTTLEYSTRVVQEGDRRCKKSTLNDLAYLTPLRIPLMNPVIHCWHLNHWHRHWRLWLCWYRFWSHRFTVVPNCA